MPVHPIDLKFWESVLWGASTPNPRFLNQLNGLAVTNAAYRHAKMYLAISQQPLVRLTCMMALSVRRGEEENAKMT